MAYTTINKSTDYFNTKLYTGNGSTNAITGVGFEPDMTWLKIRTQSYSHRIYDAVRGATKYCHPDTSEEQYTTATSLTAFNSDGFTLGSNAGDNKSGDTFVSWNWKAGTGQGSSNTDGSINTTYTSVNTTAGFSISQYTATGNNATVGHGLGVAPKMILFKNLNRTSSNAQSWGVYHQALGNTKFLQLDTGGAENQTSPTSLFFNDTSPTSSVFSIGTNNRVNADAGDTYIAYAFAEKTGYSKFGSYTGNANADGTFIYTGFKPAWFMFKDTESTTSWIIKDNKRLGYNGIVPHLQANTNDAENTDGWSEVDFLSNGIKLRNADNSMNKSGSKFIYMAFGQSLVGSNNVPCTAR